jgi:hypothetical protein
MAYRQIKYDNVNSVSNIVYMVVTTTKTMQNSEVIYAYFSETRIFRLLLEIMHRYKSLNCIIINLQSSLAPAYKLTRLEGRSLGIISPI